MVISGGIAAGEPCKEGRQKGPPHLRPAQRNLPSVEISEDDYRRAATPYDDDPLVIEVKVDNLKVKRVLVDVGSSSDIISLQCLRKLRHNPGDIEQVYGPLVGFRGSIVRPIGSILLPVSFGIPPVIKEVAIRLANLTTFSIILGRPTLNDLKAVIVPHLLLVKFVGSNGRVGSLYGNQQLARDCYLSTLEPTAWGASPKGKEQTKPPASRRKTRKIPTEHNAERRPEPVGALYDVILDLADPSRTVPIGVHPDDPMSAALVQLLQEYKEIFSFTVEEMPGINPAVAVHKLNVDSTVKPVRQKKRNHGEARNLAAAAEVKKLMDADFIRPCQYPDWVANVVLVPKPNKTWRMCVDYTDLNKACPKDSFPLPKIDRLVDSTAGHAMISFMDAYSGFHQIPLWPEDQEKTSFVTEQGLYCYKQKKDHLDDLRETFETVRTYQMRLNPKKCIFGVSSGKFLGFLIDERGIEANPDKVQAVIDMTSPRTVKDVQRLTGCLAALGRFLSRAGDKCNYFFSTIKKRTQFEWTTQAEAAFLRLKEHLHTLPRLVSPLLGEVLYLYLAISEYALSAVLLTEREGTQLPVKKLRPYFLAHRLVVYTDQPLKRPFTNLEASGRMLNWAIELHAFDISYEPRKWIVHVDGSATQNGSGAGIFCESPEGDIYEYAMRFNFQASNNEAEYEALICGIQMSRAAGAADVLVLSDSQLIVSQVKGEYEAKDEAMIRYLKKVRQEAQQLSNFEVKHIPRSENNKADALSKLASSASCDTPRHVFWEPVLLRNPSEKNVIKTLGEMQTNALPKRLVV
ncbi:uncharacterized protein [Spinacia oleracea]|uniref:RNase H type-1 domain-containing protein n=1 Tax=Spinacia oleracea TaxID=3562 RepID=A0ABM3QZL2_SPIOL|nr:uncharacterized protein LOC130463620 [Spinacia oleracea]